MPGEINHKEITKAHTLTEMRSKGFSPNKLITLLGHQYSSLDDVRGAYAHTINVLQRKIYGRYGQKIKHMAVAEKGHHHDDYALKKVVWDGYKQKLKTKRVAETGNQSFDYKANTSKSSSHIHALIECDEDWLEMNKWKDGIKSTWMKTRIGTGISLIDDREQANRTWFKDVYQLEDAVGYCFKNSNDAEQYQFIDRKY
jgi:hypothetical protein